MAKKSMLEREKKREKMVATYAKLHAELKAKGDYAALSQLPANASPVRLHNRCKVPAVLTVICVNWASAASHSVNWLTKVRSLALKKPAGNTYSMEGGF